MDHKLQEVQLSRNVWAEIDLGRLRQNILIIKKALAKDTKFCAVVKANAYGHGAVEVAKLAVSLGACYLAVATIQEGVELRLEGITAPILVLGPIAREEARFVVEYSLTQAVFTLETIDALAFFAKKFNKISKVHLALDTGMGRIGISYKEAHLFAKELLKREHLFLEGVFSHFATADHEDKAYAKQQLQRFLYALKKLEEHAIHIPLRHLANSAAIFSIKEAHFDMVRAGIILYGYQPSDTLKIAGILPCMKIRARITALRHIVLGESVGYGKDFVAKKDTCIATLPLGYADGYLRGYQRGGFLVHEKTKTPLYITGRICMDQLMAEVPYGIDVQIGDVVTVLGDYPSADDLAKLRNTISYEVLTSISPRVGRIYLHNKF